MHGKSCNQTTFFVMLNEVGLFGDLLKCKAFVIRKMWTPSISSSRPLNKVNVFLASFPMMHKSCLRKSGGRSCMTILTGQCSRRPISVRICSAQALKAGREYGRRNYVTGLKQMLLLQPKNYNVKFLTHLHIFLPIFIEHCTALPPGRAKI